MKNVYVMTQEKKPTEAHKKELLSKLESIIKILNDQGDGNSDIPILRETVDASLPTIDEQLLATPLDTSSMFENHAHKVNPTTSEPPDQQPLFKETKNQEKNPVKMENPFLPQRIRARLYSEARTPQSPGNRTDEDKRDIGLPYDLHDSIIDNLIAFYLPKIEADLRRRLKSLAIKETHNKT